MKASVKRQTESLWESHREAWKASGISQRAYCKRENISYSSFVYQHNRLKSRSKKAPLSFIEVKPESTVISSPTGGLQLILPNGIRIDIGAEINPVVLQTVLRVAGAVQCLS